MNSVTGEIRLAQTLDFEERQVIEVTYVATDGGGLSSSVPFRLNVLDYNDQGPVFPLDQYNTIVTESSTLLNPNVTVQVGYKIFVNNTFHN